MLGKREREDTCTELQWKSKNSMSFVISGWLTLVVGLHFGALQAVLQVFGTDLRPEGLLASESSLCKHIGGARNWYYPEKIYRKDDKKVCETMLGMLSMHFRKDERRKKKRSSYMSGGQRFIFSGWSYLSSSCESASRPKKPELFFASLELQL